VDLAIVKIPLRPDRAVCIGWAVAAYRHMLKSSCAEPPSDIFAEKKKIRLVFFGKRVCVTERERERVPGPAHVHLDKRMLLLVRIPCPEREARSGLVGLVKLF
jgi:hypothetical protein